MMASSKKKQERRSWYGNRQSLTASRKSLQLSVTTDRVKYRYRKNEDEENKSFHPDSLLLITQHQWNLYRVSHLYRVEYSTVKLKQYGARIRQELIKNVKDTSDGITFSVKVQALPELKDNDEDSNSLLIEVFYNKDQNKPVLKYRGVILSWGNNHSKNNLTQLPLLLCVGTLNTTRIVHKTLSSFFDTLLHPLRISEDDLMWLSAMLSDSTNRKNSVTYDFSLNGSTVKNPIMGTLSCTLIKDLWNHTHPPESDEISYHEVQIFHKLLQDQLKALYGINFNLLKLNKIEMCDATIACEGKVKIFNEEAAVQILSFISDVSLLLDSPNVTIGSETINNTL